MAGGGFGGIGCGRCEVEFCSANRMLGETFALDTASGNDILFLSYNRQPCETEVTRDPNQEILSTSISPSTAIKAPEMNKVLQSSHLSQIIPSRQIRYSRSSISSILI